MVMKKRTVFIIILICVVVISFSIVGIFHIINENEVIPMEYEKNSDVVGEEGPMLLNEEQQQILKDSILESEFEEMNNVQRKSAWLLLDAMNEINFEENTYPGESGVFHAVWILERLGIEAIEGIDIVRVEEGFHDLSGDFIARIITNKR